MLKKRYEESYERSNVSSRLLKILRKVCKYLKSVGLVVFGSFRGFTVCGDETGARDHSCTQLLLVTLYPRNFLSMDIGGTKCCESVLATTRLHAEHISRCLCLNVSQVHSANTTPISVTF